MTLRMFVRTLLTVIILLCSTTLDVRAQQVDPAAKPDRGLGHGSFAISDIENVNLTNGNLNLSIPLASLPPIAGGKLSWTIRAVYNSKLWDMKAFQMQPDSHHTQPWTYYVDQLSDSGGWIVAGGFQLQHWLADSDVEVDCGTDQFCQLALAYRHKMILRTPDGTTHELRPLDGQHYTGVGSQSWRRGFYNNTPDNTGQPMRYYSYDGSFLWAVIYPLGSSVEWVVYMPDGTSVTQFGESSNSLQQIKDANGNKIDITSTGNLAGDVSSVFKDVQTGREIRYDYSAANKQGQVRYQKVGGTWETITINFATKSLTGKVVNAGDRACFSWGTLLAEPFEVITSIVLPQTQPGITRQISFEYNSDTIDTLAEPIEFRGSCGAPVQLIHSASRGWGELSRVTLPSGAVAEYSYKRDGPFSLFENLLAARLVPANGIVQKSLMHDGGTDVWSYAISNASGQVTGPDGLLIKEDFFERPSEYGASTGGTTGFEGLVYRTTQMKASNSQKMIIQERQWEMRKFDGGVDESPSGRVAFNPVVTKEFTTLCDSSGNPSLMSAKKFQHDFNGHRSSTLEYDFFNPNSVVRDANGMPLDVQGVSPVRTTTTTFHNGAPLASSNNVYAKRLITSGTPLILNAPQETIVGPSRTQYNYDGIDGAPPTKGNLTKMSRWEGSKWIHTTHTYDPFTGNLLTTTDPNLNVARFSYDATKALPSSVEVDPLNGSGPQISSTVYDFWTGLATSATDRNQKTTSTDYTNQLLGTIDPFGRPGIIIDPQGRKTVTRYFDNNAQPNNASQVEVWTDLNQLNDGLLKSRTTIDQLGRQVKTESTEDGVNYTIFANTQYEQGGRIKITTNPMRVATASTDGWTRTTSDELGRVMTVEVFSGRFPGGSLAGVVTTSYNRNVTTVTDQANKVRRSLVDGLGRLIRADEPDSNGNLGNVDLPVQPTHYSYDVLGNLTQVVQGNQPARRFVYDALSRLKQATHAESGTINYTYDDNGNLKTKTDARNVVTTLSYDGLNRLIGKSYSGPAPGGTTHGVTYRYDESTVANSKGRLTAVTSSVSSYTYGSYDSMGRVLTGTQTTDGRNFSMSHQYNLAGGMTSLTYPTGKIVVTEYDSAGRIAGVRKDGTNYYAGGAPATVQAINYTAHGAATTMKLGNGRWQHTNFNSLMQADQMGLGTSSIDSTILRLDFGYGGAANNGNLLSQRIVVAGVGGMDVTQNYTYDSLNQLVAATETRTSDGAQHWRQTYDIDRYGNRAVRTGSLVLNSALTPQSTSATDFSAFDQMTNRLSQATFPNLLYDNAGNMTRDQIGRTISYDAENHQITFNGNTAQYFYDGSGRRVKKVDASGTTVFVYDFGGHLIAEYPSVALSNATNYLTGDHLGSTRVVTDAAGNVKARYDYLPFGEEIPSTIGPRGSVAGYGGADTTRQKFTEKERDSESGLDYFGARYYSSAQARFLSVDAMAGSSLHVVNPQRWNGYVYVGNNPLARTDIKGHWWTGHHDRITREAYKQARIPENTKVNWANKNADFGGKYLLSLGLTPIGIIPVMPLKEMYVEGKKAELQRNHFLRSEGEKDSVAYTNAINEFERNAKHIQQQLKSGKNADVDIGKGLHQVQDAFAHTTRNSDGEIVHIQCYNCSHPNYDHKHPDFERDGRPTPEAQGAIDASAAYLKLMQSAAQMTVEEFEKALKEFEEKYLKLHPVFNAELKPRY